ncbi:DUF4405 domain-containing protein [bacterium]|nr:DUF4405 domain-containing protein [bacterium]
MKKNTVRQPVSIVLGLSFLFTVISGIFNFFPPFSEKFSPGHAVGACIFCVICIIHIWLNWKSFIRHLRILG